MGRNDLCRPINATNRYLLGVVGVWSGNLSRATILRPQFLLVACNSTVSDSNRQSPCPRELANKNKRNLGRDGRLSAGFKRNQ